MRNYIVQHKSWVPDLWGLPLASRENTSLLSTPLALDYCVLSTWHVVLGLLTLFLAFCVFAHLHLTTALSGRGFLKSHFRDEKTEARKGLKFRSGLLRGKKCQNPDLSPGGLTPDLTLRIILLYLLVLLGLFCFHLFSHFSLGPCSPLWPPGLQFQLPVGGLCLKVFQGHLTPDPYSFITDFIAHRYLAPLPCAGNVLGVRDEVVKTKGILPSLSLFSYVVGQGKGVEIKRKLKNERRKGQQVCRWSR